MELYHGSNMIVKKPTIIIGDRFKDFGVGFYTTSYREQAVRWAHRVLSRSAGAGEYVNLYECDIEKAKRELKILEFPIADEAWLDFVVANRRGKPYNESYEIVIGPVADDSVYSAIKLYETGVYDLSETIKRLKTEELFNQILFHTERSLEYLKFIKAVNKE
ncbi:MAG: DUF3990 domain-containing protein [Clostridiales bacterium]|jgi:hypothetical protein|nr:DUF3990 domain-containing protein [Clostridiales bacterium]